jgi:hypothetical protein
MRAGAAAQAKVHAIPECQVFVRITFDVEAKRIVEPIDGDLLEQVALDARRSSA